MNKLVFALLLLPVVASASAYRETADGHRLTVNALQNGYTCQKVYLDFDGTSFEVTGVENRNMKTCQNMSDGQYENGTLQVQVIGIGGEVNPWAFPTCDAVINIEGVAVGDMGTIDAVYCNKRSWDARRIMTNAGRHTELHLTAQQAKDQNKALDEKYGAFKKSLIPINYDVYTSSSDISNTKSECK